MFRKTALLALTLSAFAIVGCDNNDKPAAPSTSTPAPTTSPSVVTPVMPAMPVVPASAPAIPAVPAMPASAPHM